MSGQNALANLMAEYRSRTSWNERLSHWELPASQSEETMIERAAGMVRNSLSANSWLTGEKVLIQAQGSYHNNTNVRREADMDLRVIHPTYKVDYDESVIQQNLADNLLGLRETGRTLSDVCSTMRSHVALSLGASFGWENLDINGNKAMRVHKLPGSRADVDIVPSFRYLWVSWPQGYSMPVQTEGVAILGKDGTWTYNFPEQHHTNGIAKRARTAHRFKKVVRSLKRIRDELVAMGSLDKKQVPSYLVECLVYAVEDPYFLVQSDDRYDRIIRILGRMSQLINDAAWTQRATEINGIKFLFHPAQTWTVDSAKAFIVDAYSRLTA